MAIACLSIILSYLCEFGLGWYIPPTSVGVWELLVSAYCTIEENSTNRGLTAWWGYYIHGSGVEVWRYSDMRNFVYGNNFHIVIFANFQSNKSRQRIQESKMKRGGEKIANKYKFRNLDKPAFPKTGLEASPYPLPPAFLSPHSSVLHSYPSATHACAHDRIRLVFIFKLELSSNVF